MIKVTAHGRLVGLLFVVVASMGCASDLGVSLRRSGYLRIHPPDSRLEPGTLVYLEGAANSQVLKVACWARQAYPKLPPPGSAARGPIPELPQHTAMGSQLLAALSARHPAIKSISIALTKTEVVGHQLAAIDTYRYARTRPCLAALAELKKKKVTVYSVLAAVRSNLRYRINGADTIPPKVATDLLGAKAGKAETLVAKESYLALFMEPLVKGTVAIIEVGTLRIREPLDAAARAKLVGAPIWVVARRSLADVTKPPPAPKKGAKAAHGH